MVGEADSGATALEVCSDSRPDVVFMDIEMPDLSGLQVASKLSEAGIHPHIVFVTAHSQFAVAAFDLCAVDYLLKPFDDERFANTLGRSEKILGDSLLREISSLAIDQYFTKPKWLRQIVVKSIGSLKIVDVSTLIWVRANGNYVDLISSDQATLHRSPISVLAEQLDPGEFVRTHRSALVRLGAIREIRTLDDKSVILLSNGDRAPLSPAFKDQVYRLLGSDSRALDGGG